MFPVEVLDGVTDGLGGTSQPVGDAAAHFGERTGADASQPACPAQNILSLIPGKLGKPAATLDLVLVDFQERIHQRRQKSHMAAALVEDRQTDQTLLPPAIDRLG